jgi:hypothetical protein
MADGMMRPYRVENELFEVAVIPHDHSLIQDMDVRLNTYETSPQAAIAKVKRYLIEKNHAITRIPANYVCHKRFLVE